MNGKKLPGEWVYGGIFQGTGDFSIIYGWQTVDEHVGSKLAKFTVYSDTIGQYTGLTDRNDVKIFEGDIVSGYFNHVKVQGIIMYGSDAAFYIHRDGLFGIGLNNAAGWLEIIGNIHDNPEILKKESTSSEGGKKNGI